MINSLTKPILSLTRVGDTSGKGKEVESSLSVECYITSFFHKTNFASFLTSEVHTQLNSQEVYK